MKVFLEYISKDASSFMSYIFFEISTFTAGIYARYKQRWKSS